MNTFFVVGTFLVWASPAALFAQAAPPAASPLPAASTPPAPRTKTLRVKFKVGETLHYRLVEDTVGYSLEPHKKLVPIQSQVEMTLHQTVTAVRETDGAGILDFGIDSMAVTVDKQKPPETTGSSPDPAILASLAKLVVLPSGKIGETLVNPLFDAAESLLGEDPAHQSVLAGLGELPPDPVQVGSKWKSLVFLGMVGEQTNASLSLTAWEKTPAPKDPATLAVIKQVLKGKFGTPAADLGRPICDMRITGWTSGTQTVRFNVEAGTVESRDSVVWMTVLLTPRNDEGRFAGTPIRMWIKVTSKLTQIAAPVQKLYKEPSSPPGPQ